MSKVFEWPIRVYFQDTDAGGVTYHASYVNFLERARTEWLRSYGYSNAGMMKELGVMFVVRSLCDEVGGFPLHPLMEDIAFSAALREAGVGAQLVEPAADAPSFDSEALWPVVAGQLHAGSRVLIVGPAGVGKEVAARLIHELGPFARMELFRQGAQMVATAREPMRSITAPC